MPARLTRGGAVVVPAALVGLGASALAAYAPLAGVAVLAAIVAGLLVLTRAELLLLLLVGVQPWNDMLSFPTETVSVVKLLGAILVIAWLLRVLARGDELRGSASIVAAAVFGLLVVLSLMASPDPQAGVNKVIRYALYITFAFLVLQLCDNPADVRRMIKVLVASTAAAATYALVGFLSGVLPRAGGPIAEPNDFAFLLLLALCLSVYLLARERHTRWLWSACFVAIGATLLATLSRSALVGLVAIVVWALLSGRVRVDKLLATATAFALVLVSALTLYPTLIHQRVAEKGRIADANAAARIAYWSAAERMAFDHPVLGVGPGRYRDETKRYLFNNPVALERPVAHNSYLEIAAENGAPALLAFLAFVAFAWRDLGRARREALAAREVDVVRLVTALQAALVGTMVAGGFGSYQTEVGFWLLAGLAAALVWRPVRSQLAFSP